MKKTNPKKPQTEAEWAASLCQLSVEELSLKGVLEIMVERGTKAWKDVPDASAWVEELRGNDAP
jgi:hypothetical protein